MILFAKGTANGRRKFTTKNDRKYILPRDKTIMQLLQQLKAKVKSVVRHPIINHTERFGDSCTGQHVEIEKIKYFHL
jgi:hypothetical protein